MVTYRIATENDYEKINDFYNQFHQPHRTIEQFKWLFHNAPAGKAIYIIAESNGRVIGTNCVIPYFTKLKNGEIIITGKSEDTLIHPDFRGQNIIDKIYKLLFEECKANNIVFIWGFTLARKTLLRCGFEIPFETMQSSCIQNIKEAYQYFTFQNKQLTQFGKFKILIFCILAKLNYIKSKLTSVSISKYNLISDKAIIEGVDELIEKRTSGHNSSYYILQSKAFQDWRIYQNPYYLSKKTFAFYNDKKELSGLVVFNIYKNKTAYIVQSTFDSELSNKIVSSMLIKISKKIFDEGITIIRNWQFDHNELNKTELKQYIASGYIIKKKSQLFVWKLLDEKSNLQPHQFYLSKISSQGNL